MTMCNVDAILPLDIKTAPAETAISPEPGPKGVSPMDTTTIHHTDHRAERMIAAYMEGAETGMVEARGYGLSPDERADAEKMARALYGEPERVAA